ncbi:MAG TPA: Cof-type HAD-IIB family hydrolase [Ignavibacteriaceae bacterium]|mgnify:FL=1|nr:Cof-type HAD-IIB family hydrolase [Ignavibacteriaceae bacterium]HRP91315.1 Cof-type HAD-IIB family hydrolase [Ignavibacteriaceae bacterium]HRQ54380.1 Cof-type HAD-IIB family hydrolase [Ignavibacteriaceae bacterium]
MFDLARLKEIELVLFDVDGTLVNDEGEIGAQTKQLIMEIKKLGVLFSFASGRLHSALVPLAEELKIHLPLISLDGSSIKSISSQYYVYRSFLKESQVKKAIELSEKYLLNIALCHAEAIYFTEQSSVIPKLMDKFGAVYQSVDSYDDYTNTTLEIVFAGDNRSTVEFVRDKLSFPFTLGTSVSFFRSQSQEGIYYLEVRRSGSSKGKAMQRLIKHLNVKEIKTAVLGDWYNDLSMFESKGIKVALQNAIPEIKKAADYIIKKTNNEEGVVEFLEALLIAKMS